MPLFGMRRGFGPKRAIGQRPLAKAMLARKIMGAQGFGGGRRAMGGRLRPMGIGKVMRARLMGLR
jgi:hypothetical protein